MKLLKKNDIRIRNYSVPEKKSLGKNLDNLYLEQKLKNRIKNCSIFLISCNANLIDSTWIRKEIRLACSYNKYILGIRPKGQKKTFDPKYIVDATKISNGKIINYKSSTILETIQDATGIKILSLKKAKVNNQKNRIKRKARHWVRILKHIFIIVLLIILTVLLFQLLNKGEMPLAKPSITYSPNDSVQDHQFPEILIVQRLLTLDSALSIKRKYSNRRFEIIYTEKIDGAPSFYISKFDFLDRKSAEKTLNKLKTKKAQWGKAKLFYLNQICHTELLKNKDYYECKQRK